MARLNEGKYTLELFAKENKLERQSALNLLSRLKKNGLAEASGGGRQKKIYTLHKLPKVRENGLYYVLNKYSPEKLQPRFEHYVHGKYNVEDAMIDGLAIQDVRTNDALMYLFNHVKDWTRLFQLAGEKKMAKQVVSLYKKARGITRCRRMPLRYLK